MAARVLLVLLGGDDAGGSDAELAKQMPTGWPEADPVRLSEILAVLRTCFLHAGNVQYDIHGMAQVTRCVMWLEKGCENTTNGSQYCDGCCYSEEPEKYVKLVQEIVTVLSCLSDDSIQRVATRLGLEAYPTSFESTERAPPELLV